MDAPGEAEGKSSTSDDEIAFRPDHHKHVPSRVVPPCVYNNLCSENLRRLLTVNIILDKLYI